MQRQICVILKHEPSRIIVVNVELREVSFFFLMGNHTSRENTKEEELLSKWANEERKQLVENKQALPEYYSKELFDSLTEGTRLDYLQTAYEILKLKNTQKIYDIFQICIKKHKISLQTFVLWTVTSSIPLWYSQTGQNIIIKDIHQHDPKRLVDYLLNYAIEQKEKNESTDWLFEEQEEKESKKGSDKDDWKVKSTSSPSTLSDIEFMDWLKNVPCMFNLFYLIAEYAFLGCTQKDKDSLHQRRLAHLASPQLSSFSELISPYDYFMLMQHVPTHCLSNDTKEINHQLLYSSKKDGISWQVFVNKIIGQGATLIIIKSKDGSVFGGYADEAWEYQKTNWYGNISNFLFQLSPKYGAWVGQDVNNHYQYLCWGKKSLPNGLGMGGQFDYCGLWVDADFLNGHSRAGPSCSTFKSPQLTKDDTFTIDKVEGKFKEIRNIYNFLY